jgi:hypothetical protein
MTMVRRPRRDSVRTDSVASVALSLIGSIYAAPLAPYNQSVSVFHPRLNAVGQEPVLHPEGSLPASAAQDRA